MGRNRVPASARVARRWGRTALRRRGHGGLIEVRERRSRRRARAGLLLAAALIASVPATSPLRARHRTEDAAAIATAAFDESARFRSGFFDTSAFDGQTNAVAGPHESVISPPPEHFDAPPAPTAPAPAALRSSSVGKSGGVWAVMIGIDNYPGSGSDLRASVADANEVDAALAAYGVPGDRRLVLRNTQASAATIADSMRWLVAHASSDATAVFFYAGHVRKVGSGAEAMVAADGRLLSDATMASLLRPLAAQRVWLGMASCYGGGFTEALAPGRILTAAADARSLAYESSAYGHSYMVEYMVKRAMVEARAPGSVERSFAWAADALRRDHPNRIPVQYDYVEGELSLGPAPKPAPAPPPQPPPSGGDPRQPEPKNPNDPPPDDDPCVIRLGSLVGCSD